MILYKIHNLYLLIFFLFVYSIFYPDWKFHTFCYLFCIICFILFYIIFFTLLDLCFLLHIIGMWSHRHCQELVMRLSALILCALIRNPNVILHKIGYFLLILLLFSLFFIDYSVLISSLEHSHSSLPVEPFRDWTFSSFYYDYFFPFYLISIAYVDMANCILR